MKQAVPPILVAFLLATVPSVQANPRAALQSVVFPTIEFAEVPLHQVLEFLQIRSGELRGSPAAAVNFILNGDTEVRNIPITLQVREVSLGQVLWFIGEIGQLRMDVDQHAIIVSKPSEWARSPAPRTSADSRVVEMVNRVTIPNLEFSEVPLSDAVDLLRVFATELDPAKKGVNLVLLPDLSGREEPTITLRLSQIPLAEGIRYTAQLAGYDVRIENGAILFAPPAPPGEAPPTTG